jgi:hypothetical protein
MGACIYCYEYDTEWFKGDHGHSMLRCNDCGEKWGPFVSPRDHPELFEQLESEEERGDGQTGLGDFS